MSWDTTIERFHRASKIEAKLADKAFDKGERERGIKHIERCISFREKAKQAEDLKRAEAELEETEREDSANLSQEDGD